MTSALPPISPSIAVKYRVSLAPGAAVGDSFIGWAKQNSGATVIRPARQNKSARISIPLGRQLEFYRSVFLAVVELESSAPSAKKEGHRKAAFAVFRGRMTVRARSPCHPCRHHRRLASAVPAP